ncbi:hypothetical protein IID22_03820 [Patescibacteria group bacterium]|nr:hypothetical protein [Patescibacteria group bacterium]
MHSYLVVGRDKEKLSKKIDAIVKKLGSKPQKFSLAKIEDVRELNSQTKLKTGSPVTFVIYDIDLATTEAQNAFLKNLEEPGINVSYVLTAQNEHKLLPTIVSRCLVIRGVTKVIIPEDIVSEVKKFLKMNSSEKLFLFSKLRDRAVAIEHLETLVLGGHQMLLNNKPDFLKISKFIKNTNRTIYALRGNGNVSLQLTNLIVNVS